MYIYLIFIYKIGAMNQPTDPTAGQKLFPSLSFDREAQVLRIRIVRRSPTLLYIYIYIYIYVYIYKKSLGYY